MVNIVQVKLCYQDRGETGSIGVTVASMGRSLCTQGHGGRSPCLQGPGLREVAWLVGRPGTLTPPEPSPLPTASRSLQRPLLCLLPAVITYKEAPVWETWALAP